MKWTFCRTPTLRFFSATICIFLFNPAMASSQLQCTKLSNDYLKVAATADSKKAQIKKFQKRIEDTVEPYIDKALSLKEQIDIFKKNHDAKKFEIDLLQSEIELTYVDKYSQSSVDAYNDKIKRVKSLIQTFNADVERHQKAVETWNAEYIPNLQRYYSQKERLISAINLLNGALKDEQDALRNIYVGKTIACMDAKYKEGKVTKEYG